MQFHYDENATPINSDEIHNLIPTHIQTQTELNMWEQNNISFAEGELFKRKRDVELSIEFIKKVHNLMFNNTWKWAGKFRTVNMNIGIDWIKIQPALKMLCDDVEFQKSNKSFDLEEIAVRFSHRLVSVHPFMNGNGRCSRLIADLLMFKAGLARFSWGNRNLTTMSEMRNCYIRALQEADKHNIEPFIEFARS
jgi:Fic-DOC domain mobile mystery protein B